MKRTTLVLLLILNSLSSFSPVDKKDLFKADTDYPKGYFRNPLDIPIKLAANFGELRPNHFHMGFDIRTNQRENLPVYAAAAGYVSKIKIEPSGFGRAIYITHPNGYTTLYAHLNDFYPALHDFVVNKQYKDQKWEQEFDLQPNQFPVAKGQFIAYSGNTGGSQGPHLHFEIRDTKTGNNLNPWLFGFGIPDKMDPFIYKLFYYDRRYSTYQSGPMSIAITGGNSRYRTVSDVVNLASPYVSFGISAEDKTVPEWGRFGIYNASLIIDDTLLSEFALNDINYTTTRYLNAAIDYRTKMAGGSYIQHLSKLPGSQSEIFYPVGNGVYLAKDDKVHHAVIHVKDAAGNTSVLDFKFRWNPSTTRELMFAANSIPMIPGKPNSFEDDDLRLTFSPAAFYDTVPFVHRSESTSDPRVISAVHYVADYKIPVHDSFTIRIKPVSEVANNDKVVMHLQSNKKIEVVKANASGEWFEARLRDFGIVKLIYDTVPPKVLPADWANGGSVRTKKSITIYTSDNAGGDIESFNAYLDGKWLMFSRKANAFTHVFDYRTSSGRHELRIMVEDAAGNIAEKNYTFTR